MYTVVYIGVMQTAVENSFSDVYQDTSDRFLLRASFVGRALIVVQTFKGGNRMLGTERTDATVASTRPSKAARKGARDLDPSFSRSERQPRGGNGRSWVRRGVTLSVHRKPLIPQQNPLSTDALELFLKIPPFVHFFQNLPFFDAPERFHIPIRRIGPNRGS